MAKLAPSLLSANFANLQKDIEILNRNKVEYLHLDIMDGHFVPNISFGPGIIRSIRPLTDMIFDVHLMIEDPDLYIANFVEAGADIITVHVESTVHLHRTLQMIKSHGIKCGVVLNPATSLETIKHVLPDIDLILIMSVNPGFGGQSFIPECLKKVKQARELIDQSNRDIILEVDGGIKTTNVEEVLKQGADLIVSGSDVFKENIEQQIEKYHKILSR